MILGLSAWLVTGVLEQWLDPRHAEREFRRELVQLAQTLDSLETANKRKDLYIENFRKLISGEDDTYANVENRELTAEEIAQSEKSTEELSAADVEFRREFERESLGTTLQGDDSELLQEVFLFNPLNTDAIVSSKFDPKINHYGIDLISRRDEPVKSSGDGTVIFADWTVEDGNVIAIQHRNNLISIYKHNSELLKKVGNFVSQGEIISIIGNTGELSTGPHLHFELWYNGNPVDPAEFIDF
ncbi:MAG: M23 family metallopeptidase [Bacteroidota bacterium]